MTEWSVRPATATDAAALSRLAIETFRETYEEHNTAANMERYMAEAFTVDRLATEIGDADGMILLAEHTDDSGVEHFVGYAHVATGPAPAAVTGAAPMEVKRFYVHSPWHGQGVAQVLMDATLDAARTRGATTLWLGVWERNARAAAFYGGYGFARVGKLSFVLGDDIQSDWLLARALDAVE